MRLRPRQKLFVERSLSALDTRDNTLGIAPTGAGKTIMLSAVTGEVIGDSAAKACVLAHRDELTAQNRENFGRVNPVITTSVVDATSKSWGGQVTFAMVPTLTRKRNLAGIPKLDLLVIDEAHHAVADSYRRIIDHVRDANPDAVILYKPHPDVEAGLRSGAVDAKGLADLVLSRTDPAALLDKVDEVWTMTSLLGFEALLRGLPVTTTGAPFYAGWGLTTDLGEIPERRTARPTLAGLVHAALIDYPRYFDPVTGRVCPVEVVVDRLAQGRVPHPGVANRALSKLQGLFATYAHLWR